MENNQKPNVPSTGKHRYGQKVDAEYKLQESESGIKIKNRGQNFKNRNEEIKFEHKQVTRSQSGILNNDMTQKRSQNSQGLYDELKQISKPSQTSSEIKIRKNKSQCLQQYQNDPKNQQKINFQHVKQNQGKHSFFQSFDYKRKRTVQGNSNQASEKEEQYLQEINLLKQVIDNQSQQMDQMKQQMGIQEKLMNMVVHDMRNPSEAINNGLTQAGQQITSQLVNIAKDLKSSFKTYHLKIKELQDQENQLQQQNLSLQLQIMNLDKNLQYSMHDFSQNQGSNLSEQKESAPKSNEEQKLDKSKIPQKKKLPEEESKHFESNINSLDWSDNLEQQNQEFPIINRKMQKIQENQMFQDQMMGRAVNANGPENLRNDYAFQIQQFINLAGNNNDQILQKNENQAEQNQEVEEEKEIQIVNLEQNEGQKLEQCINEIHTGLMELNKLISDHQKGNRVQNRDDLNLNEEIQEDENYQDFLQDDLDEVQQPREPQAIQPIQNQIIQQINNIVEKDFVINQIRNIKVQEGSRYVKRSNQNNFNEGQVDAREVSISKQENILKTDSAVQTQDQNEVNLQFKNGLFSIINKIKQNIQKIENNENFQKMIQTLNEIKSNQRQFQKMPLKQDQKQQLDVIQVQKENKDIQQMQQLKMVKQMMDRQRKQSVQSIQNIKKNSYILRQNFMRQRGFSLCNSQIINDFKKISPNAKQEECNSIQNQLVRQNSIIKDGQSVSCNPDDFCNEKCQFCAINKKLIVDILQRMKQALKLVTNTEFFLKNSISSANVISNLTEDLLTLAKMKNSVFELNIEQNVNLLEVVYDAFQVLSFNASQKNISFQLEHQKNKKYLVQNVAADKRRILQILLNFISNSIKFTSQNGLIKVILKVVSESTSNKDLNFNQIMQSEQIEENQNELIEKTIILQMQIQDNGAGISQESQQKLFSDFGKLNEHKQMNIKGTGLGLSICKQLIEQMGGNVRVQSKVGVGSKFIIELEMQAIDNLSQCNIFNSQKSLRELYSEKIINNFTMIDKQDEDDIYLSPERSHSSNKINRLSQNAVKNKVLFQFLHSSSKSQDDKNDECQNMINSMIKKMKLKKIISIDVRSQCRSIVSSSNHCNIIHGLSAAEESIEKQILAQNHLNQQNNQQQNQNEIIQSLNISRNSNQNSDQLNNRIKQEQNAQQNFNWNNSYFMSNENKKYKNKSMDQEIEQESLMMINQSCVQEQNLNQIEESQEYGSQFNSDSISNNNMSASIMQSQQSNQVQNIKIPLDFQNYLDRNETLKQVFDISFKYNREKLKFLAANDEGYTLFFIQTCVDKFQNVSQINTALNGQEALDLVKNNEPADQNQSNFYNVIFLDLEMPIMNGNEACKQIQQHYYSLRGKSSLEDMLQDMPQVQNKLNLINKPNVGDQTLVCQEEEWIIDLKKVYDIYQEIVQNQKFEQGMSKENNIRFQQKMRNETLKVFNILYQKLRYKSLRNLGRPFMFAYSAFINKKVIDDTVKSGFDKCIEAPLNQVKIEKLLDDYVENYCLHFTKRMLEKLGPVPKFEEMIDFQQIYSGNKKKSSSLYSSLFRIQERNSGAFKLNSNEILKQNLGQSEQENEFRQQKIELCKINETFQENSQSSVHNFKQDSDGMNENKNIIFEEEKKQSEDGYCKQKQMELKKKYFN